VKNILGHKMTQAIVGLFILLGVYIIMYPPDIEIFKKTSEFAVQAMFGMLFLGFVFLIFNQTRLMFISMMACGLLAFYLKTASNSNMMFPEQNILPKLKVAHFNLASFEKYDKSFQKLIYDTDCDVISFQEYTPDWDNYVAENLLSQYPFAHRMTRADLFGMAIFSKKRIKNTEVFKHNDIPNLNITINSGVQDVHIISSHIAPSLISKVESKDHLAELADYIDKLKNPSITLGDFNQVNWSQNIKEFRDKTGLSPSRRRPASISITEFPYDHIFYSKLLECIKFWEIEDGNKNHLGIAGIYQTKTSVSNPAILRTIGNSESR